MDSNNVVWHEEDEYVVMEKNGWRLLLVANHFKYKFWYEVQQPEGAYPDFHTTDIYEAINYINENISN